MGSLTGRNPEMVRQGRGARVHRLVRDHDGAGSTEPKPSYSHSFDAGSAWMAIALQAHDGVDAHGMVGYDIGRSAES